MFTGTFQLSHTSELESFDWGIRVQAGSVARRLGSIYEVRYGELTEARLVGRLAMHGIRFHAECLPPKFVFLTADFREILDLLEQHGVPVNRKAGMLMAP